VAVAVVAAVDDVAAAALVMLLHLAWLPPSSGCRCCRRTRDRIAFFICSSEKLFIREFTGANGFELTSLARRDHLGYIRVFWRRACTVKARE